MRRRVAYYPPLISKRVLSFFSTSRIRSKSRVIQNTWNQRILINSIPFHDCKNNPALYPSCIQGVIHAMVLSHSGINAIGRIFPPNIILSFPYININARASSIKNPKLAIRIYHKRATNAQTVSKNSPPRSLLSNGGKCPVKILPIISPTTIK